MLVVALRGPALMFVWTNAGVLLAVNRGRSSWHKGVMKARILQG